MKTALLFVCAVALGATMQASTLCTVTPGTWCEQPVGPDAGQYISTAQTTVGTTSGEPLNSIQGQIDGLGGADMFAIYIPNPLSFAAGYTPLSVTYPNGNLIADTAQAGLFLFSPGGIGIEAASDGTTLGGFNGTAGIYYIDITGDGNVLEYGSTGNTAPIFTPFVAGQIALPAPGAGPLSAYSGNGCGVDCAGGYDITLTGTDYAATPEPASIALTGSVITLMGLLCRFRVKRNRTESFTQTSARN